MSVPMPQGRLQWGLAAFSVALVATVAVVGAVAGRQDEERSRRQQDSLDEICAVERKSLEDAKHQYEEMKVRQKERCDEKLAKWEKERETLMERVSACPCCEGGCTEELVYKDYLLQSQATYYKKHLKKVCGVRRPPDPDEKELKKFMDEIEEEEDEVF